MLGSQASYTHPFKPEAASPETAACMCPEPDNPPSSLRTQENISLSLIALLPPQEILIPPDFSSFPPTSSILSHGKQSPLWLVFSSNPGRSELKL